MYKYPLYPRGHRREEIKELTTITFIKLKKTKYGNGTHKGGPLIAGDVSKEDTPLIWLLKIVVWLMGRRGQMDEKLPDGGEQEKEQK